MLYLIVAILFVLSIALSVQLQKVHRRIKIAEKAVKRLEGGPEPLDEPAEWL